MTDPITGSRDAMPVEHPCGELIAQSPLALALFDANGEFVSCSSSWRRVIPASERNEAAWKAFRSRHKRLIGNSRAAAEDASREPIEVWSDEGERRCVRLEIGPIMDAAGELKYLVAHAHDVTRHLQVVQDLQRSQDRLNAALGLERMVVLDVDLVADTTVMAGDCENLVRALRSADANLSHIHPEDRPRMQAAMASAFSAGVDNVAADEFRLNIDPPTWASATTRVFVGDDGRPERLLIACHDITDRVRARAEMERLAFTDALTGLPNRAKFQLEFERVVAEADATGRAVGLVMVDVDHFKDINDTLGHDAGDALLESLAAQMRRVFRNTDVVARLGGDEFAILLTDLKSEADMVRPLNALRGLLATPIEYKGQGVRISTSIGAALHNDPDADPAHLRKNADIALYKAKDQGRDRVVVFEPQMRSEVEQRLELLRDVRAAIPRGEFTMFYQPVVNLDDAVVTGFEALMRWNHPDHGILAPSHFMAALEDQDLSLQLGEITIETALSQMRAWMDEGLAFGTVSINLSAAQFRTGHLAEDLRGRLQRWGVPPERLTVEVTENVYLGWGAEIVSETVRALHDHGVGIALDDFGTGYASLANLRQFPIDRLKIDKSFVQNTQDDAIVRAVINLGASMGMEVVAEGVERSDQLNALSRYGCQHVQGFHFAKPMPPEEVPGYLAAFKKAIAPKSAA